MGRGERNSRNKKYEPKQKGSWEFEKIRLERRQGGAKGKKKRSHRAQIRSGGNFFPGRTLCTFEVVLSNTVPTRLSSGPPLLPSLCTENEESCCRLVAEHC